MKIYIEYELKSVNTGNDNEVYLIQRRNDAKLAIVGSYGTHSSVTRLEENETRQPGLTGMLLQAVRTAPALSIYFPMPMKVLYIVSWGCVCCWPSETEIVGRVG